MSVPTVLLLHGPNLNLLGQREPEVYGTATLADHVARAERAAAAHDLAIDAVQSNHEGDLVDAIHGARGRCAAIIINPGAFTHYAWSLHDALAAFDGPVVELHLSNPNAREPWRHTSVVAPVAERLHRRLRRVRLPARGGRRRRPPGPEGMTMDLPPIGYDARPDAVRTALDGRTLIVSTPSNIRWLTGFGGSLGWVVVGPDRFALVTDGRYADRAAADLSAAGLEADVIVGTTRPQLREHLVAAAGDGRPVLAEAGHLTHAAWLDLATSLELEPDSATITGLRRVKDRGEVARMARAAEIADAALVDVAPMLGERPTEADVRDELEHTMRRLGADGPSYDTIVASGPDNAARPHHQTGRRTIVEGDTVIIDVGALVDGYHSDMTRTFVVGEPTAEQQEIYELVRAAQQAGLDAVAAGARTRDVDAACRDLLAAAGYGDWFVHGTGHGVGLDIHEDPFSNTVSDAELVVGDVVTVEPGLYRGGFGGVRIEDLVTVTADGCRRLTHLSKDTPCLPSRPTT